MKKKFSLFGAVMTVICVVFVAEAAAPAAAIGNTQFFWWIFLLGAFLIPYGLIASELGTTYVSEGGITDWVNRAYGKKWSTRVAWYYWINFPLWMASLSLLAPNLLSYIFNYEFPVVFQTIFALAFIWIVVIISLFPISDSTWILNTSAIIKMFLAILIGVLGVYVAINHGMATNYTIESMIPKLDLNSLSFVSVIIFNLLGFEVLCTFSNEMENPRKQIPQAIIVSGIVIAAIYLFSSFGISAGIPSNQINAGGGLIDAFKVLTNTSGGILVSIVSLLFLLTLFGNMISWSMGVNNTACYSAEVGGLPAIFGKRRKKNNLPLGAALMNGLVASIIVIVAPIIPSKDIFWSFFSLNIVMFLVSYVPVFPAFYKLRKIDALRQRPFKVKGDTNFLKVITVVPMLVILVSIFFTVVPLGVTSEMLTEKIPLIIGAIICFAIGECIVRIKK